MFPPEQQPFGVRRRIVESWHRFYDPTTGRYISADPIGLRGGMNLYIYALGNPVANIDPDGQLVQYCTRKFKNKHRIWTLHHAFIEINGTRWGVQPDGMFHEEPKGVDERCGKAIKCIGEAKLMALILTTKIQYHEVYMNCQTVAKLFILLSKKKDCCE